MNFIKLHENMIIKNIQASQVQHHGKCFKNYVIVSRKSRNTMSASYLIFTE